MHSDQNGNIERAELATSRLNCTCLTFDLSGHGSSEGELSGLSIKDHIVDLAAAYEFLVSVDSVNRERIGICAASYGSYLSGLFLAMRPIRRILLRAPALYDDLALETRLDVLQPSDPGAQADRYFNALERYDGDMLVVESGADDVISPRIIRRYLNVMAHPNHRVIAGASHHLATTAWRAEFQGILLDWFAAL